MKYFVELDVTAHTITPGKLYPADVNCGVFLDAEGGEQSLKFWERRSGYVVDIPDCSLGDES